ncbi:MAG TPA: oligosaccharide flippase family protein, partial [Feifaniaceae bacterium]|nr:oligosaccharide flippase family protein [Feifaniaceae bacterium]
MENKQLRWGVLLTYSTGIVQILANLLLTGVMVQKLGAAEYGLYLMLGSLVAYVSIFDFGLNNTVSRYVAKYRAEGDKQKEGNLLFITFAFYCAIALVIVGTGLLMNARLDLFIRNISPEQEALAHRLFLLLIINLAVTLPINSFAAILVGYERFIYTRTVSILRILAVPLFSIPCLLLGSGSLAVVVVTTAANIAAGLMNAASCFFKCKIKIRLYSVDIPLMKEILLYSLYVFLGIVADQLFYNTGNIVLGVTKGPEAVTEFGLSIQLTQYLVAIAAAFTGVFLPRATFLVSQTQDRERLTDFFSRISRMLSMILMCVLGGYIALGNEFTYFWVGQSMGNVYPLSLVMMFFTVWTLTRTMGLSILQAMNRHGFRSVVLLIRAAVNFALCWIVSGRYGASGVACSYAACMIVTNLVLDFYYDRKIGIAVFEFTRRLAPICLCAFFAAAGVMATYLAAGYSIYAFLIRGVLYLAVFLLLLYRFCLTAEERRKVWAA